MDAISYMTQLNSVGLAAIFLPKYILPGTYQTESCSFLSWKIAIAFLQEKHFFSHRKHVRSWIFTIKISLFFSSHTWMCERLHSKTMYILLRNGKEEKIKKHTSSYRWLNAVWRQHTTSKLFITKHSKTMFANKNKWFDIHPFQKISWNERNVNIKLWYTYNMGITLAHAYTYTFIDRFFPVRNFASFLRYLFLFVFPIFILFLFSPFLSLFYWNSRFWKCVLFSFYLSCSLGEFHQASIIFTIGIDVRKMWTGHARLHSKIVNNIIIKSKRYIK